MALRSWNALYLRTFAITTHDLREPAYSR